MISDDIFYTKTMAKVYADQGQLDQAAKIYRHLLQKNPERQDLIEALSEIDKKLFNKDPGGLSELFNTWMELLFIYNRLQKLNKLKKWLK